MASNRPSVSERPTWDWTNGQRSSSLLQHEMLAFVRMGHEPSAQRPFGHVRFARPLQRWQALHITADKMNSLHKCVRMAAP